LRDRAIVWRILSTRWPSKDHLGEELQLEPSIADAVSRFGKAATAKLSNPVVSGEPEDQLRAPFETLLADITALIGLGSTLRTKLLKIGAAVLRNTRRVRVLPASAHPMKHVFLAAATALSP
jgi:hypothetical protein